MQTTWSPVGDFDPFPATGVQRDYGAPAGPACSGPLFVLSHQVVAVLVEEPVQPLNVISRAALIQSYRGALPVPFIEYAWIALDCPMHTSTETFAVNPVQERPEPRIDHLIAKKQANLTHAALRESD